MNRQCDRGSMDTEIRRFKNRVRQQRYRARKREEQIKRIVDANRADRTTLIQGNAPPVASTILCMASMANHFSTSSQEAESMGTAQKTDEIKRNEGNGIRSADAQRFAIFKGGENGNCHKDAESTQAVCGRTILPTGCSSHSSRMSFQNGNPCEFPMPNILLPIYGMEAGCSVNTREDIMTRRLKNRERQRRYRARKRLEADIRNAQHPTKQPNPLQLGLQPKGFIRVEPLARRDWKKDARNAHAQKFPQILPLELEVSALKSGSECQAHIKQGQPLEANICDSEDRPQRRRDWKAAARSKAG